MTQESTSGKRVRIIARLDIKGPNVVKGIRFEGLRVVGQPAILGTEYYRQGIDEIIYIDTVASLYGRNHLEEFIKDMARRIFIPITVGGGIRTVEDVGKLLNAGADKVAINTAAFKNPQLIRDAVAKYGSQCITASIQSKKRINENYECLTDNARETTGVSVWDWAHEVVRLGAGEVLLTSVDQDGTGLGYDIDLLARLSVALPVPVIACGGAGNMSHFSQALILGKADALAAGSVFHYGQVGRGENLKYGEGNLDFLKNPLFLESRTRKGIQPVEIQKLKEHLILEGYSCRQAIYE